MTILYIGLGLLAVILTLRYPYLGIVFTASSLPVADALPAIPLATSVVPILGGVTLVSFLFSRKKDKTGHVFQLTGVQYWGLAFLMWMFITNPQAAVLGPDRNWIFTFVQLWLLAWLSGALLDSQDKQKKFMWIYSITTVISSIVAIQQGGLGLEPNPGIRAAGLSEGANSAARYFVVAMVFFYYLRVSSKKRLYFLLATAGFVVTFLSVFATLSRTGMLLLASAIFFLVVLQQNVKYRLQLFFVFVLSFGVLLFFSDNVTQFISRIIPSIVQGADTAGLRYSLWLAGWRMWLENMIAGVGIGMYRWELGAYAYDLIHPRYWLSVTHNMYIQVLAETGFVGLFIFVIMLLKTFRIIWRSGYSDDSDGMPLKTIWIVIFMVLLLGGITKSDQADKLLWIVIGLSTYFYKQIDDNKINPDRSMTKIEVRAFGVAS